MKTWQITIRSTGQHLGIYSADSKKEAHERIYNDAGYESVAACCEAMRCGQTPEELFADLMFEELI